MNRFEEKMPMMQSLESRQMLSVTLLEGVLSVEGTDGNDVVSFSVDSTIPETALGYRFDIVLRGREQTPMEKRPMEARR